MQTRQQKDALQALSDVQKIQEKGDEFKKSYATAVHRFPFLVRQNGLQQTLAFYAGKAHAKDENEQNPSNTAEGLFLDHILTTLNLHSSGPAEIEILKKLAGTELESYMRYTRRCMEVALWYRRFVESVLKIDATGNITKNEDSKKEVGDVDSDATNSPS
jgi:CRISPR-associated protein Cmr5